MQKFLDVKKWYMSKISLWTHKEHMNTFERTTKSDDRTNNFWTAECT